MAVTGEKESTMQGSRNRDHIHHTNTFGQRSADVIANGMGSWPFVITQTVFIIVWVILNLVGFLNHWDAYPFILLNLLFSTQAAYAAPIIMMSQNRASQKDHLRDDHEAAEVEVLFKINRQQLEILHLLREHLGVESPANEAREHEIQQEQVRMEDEAKELAEQLDEGTK
jgi:uncharacterized membrane protein